MNLVTRAKALLAFAVLLASLAAVTALAGPARGESAAAPLDPVRETLRADAAVQRADCATRALAGRRGVATTTFTAGRPATLTVRLDGAGAGDWDLALFDRVSGQRLGGSAAFGADEVVQRGVAAGQSLTIQACRVSGRSATVPLTIESAPLPTQADLGLPGTKQMVEIPLNDRTQVGVLEALGIDLVDNPHAHGIEALIHSPSEIDLLKAAGFEPKVRIPDVAAFDLEQAKRTAEFAKQNRQSRLPSGRTQYRTLADIQAELKALVQQHPTSVRPVTLPKATFQGRRQTGVEISSDVNRADDQKPVSFIMGTHHAREWPSAELTTEFALYLARNLDSNPQVTELLKRVRVVIVPVINPDGYVASRESPDPADRSGDPLGAPSLAESVAVGGSLAYRRKNCKGPGGPTAPCDFNNGVDPNRNYALGWGGIGASTTPTSQSYRGPGPWSEEETSSVHEYSQVRNVTSLLTMHNFGSLVLRPPGRRTDGQAPDEARLKALGDAMSEDTGYTSQYGFQLYDTSGTTEDWNYGAAGTYGYTMELGPASSDGGNFHIAYDRGVVDQWVGTGDREGRGVRRALMRIAEAAAMRQDHSTLIGRTPPGRILRLKKTFKTSTSPVCSIASPTDVRPNVPVGDPSACVAPTPPRLIDDRLEYTTTTSANGVFDWIVTPSTRPFEHKAGRRESWTMTCEDAAGTVFETRQVEIWRGEVQSFELPCGGTLTGPTPTTVEQAESLRLVDKLAPRTTFTRKRTRVSRNRVSFAGRSADAAPQGLTPRVAKVRISIGRRTGKLCRWLNAEGRFGPKVSCLRTPYVVARVARPARSVGWSYSLGKRLPRGRYLAWARGIDAVGNIEKKNQKRNLVRFTIR